MIDRLLQPLLSLHGWQAYTLVGLLVFAEAAVMLGFVFPGETAAILGGVLASKGGVNLDAILAVVVVCAIVGDSVGYAVGERWGRQLLQLGPLRKRQKGLDTALDQLNRRGPVAVFVARFSAFLRAVVPGLAGMSSMHYRTFLAANAAGGLCWGVLYVLLGYFVGQSVEKATGNRVRRRPGPHLRRDRGARRAPPPQGEGGDRGTGRDGGSRERRRPADHRRRSGRSAQHRAGPRRADRRPPGRTPPRRRRPGRRCP